MNDTTTSKFQSQPNYYKTIKECVDSKKQKVQTNPRYKNFTQTHFTAGDENQFQEYRDETNGTNFDIPLIQDDNVYADLKLFDDWDSYKNVPAISVYNTFSYLFHKFKKAVFVKIKDNKVVVFLPFSKHKYVNEWSDKIKVDPTRFRSIIEFMRYVSTLEGYGKFFNEKRVNGFVDTWYANNCIVRSEYPTGEGDSGICEVYDMLNELCANRKVPDIELFLNRRDFPLLKRDKTEPYNNIFGTETLPLLSHNYDKYIPILSHVTTNKYADIPIPTTEDWARVRNIDGIFFSDNCKASGTREYIYDFNTPWNTKKNIAVFRGGSTGCGVTIETNPRLKISYLGSIQQNKQYIDAGITSWNLRPRKTMNSNYLQTIEKNKMPFKLVDFLSPEQQSQYKYIINIDGHVSAFRISLELNMGSTLLLVDSPWKMWFSKFLIPYVHYVPVNADLSNLIDQVKWCQTHDNECETIANNARQFYIKYLSKNAILDYLQKILCDLKSEMGIYLYNYQTPLQYQISKEHIDLINIINKLPPIPYEKDITNSIIHLYPRQPRSFGLLKGLEYIVRLVLSHDDWEKFFTIGPVIHTSKNSIVTEQSLAGFPMAIKNTKIIDETIHEAFLGLTSINNIIKNIPNFVYTFGIKNNILISEKIDGISFTDYIDSQDFNIKDYIFILFQLALAIQVAQNECGFVHWDLHVWNIIIQKIPHFSTFDYVISYNKVMRIKTNIIPIIIDYGKSHTIYNHQHHGYINMFKMSTIQDILTIIISSLYKILNTYNGKLKPRLSRENENVVIQLSNFFTNTEYRKKRFSQIPDITSFLHIHRTFVHLISSNKYDLEQKTPLDFISYLINNIHLSSPINFEIVSNISYNMDVGNPIQVFDYILASNEKERIKSFTNVFKRIIKCNNDSFHTHLDTEPEDYHKSFNTYFALQNYENNASSILAYMNLYFDENNIIHSVSEKQKYTKKYTKCSILLDNIFNSYNPQTPPKFDSLVSIKNIDYNENIFLDIDTLTNTLQQLPKIDLSSITYKNIIENTLLNTGKYKITDKKYYIETYKPILDINIVNIMTIRANYFSLLNTSYELANYNIEVLSKLEQTPTIINFINSYQNIKDIIKTI